MFMQVSVTPETRARIRTIAQREEIPQAQVIRDIIDAGLKRRETQSEALTTAR